jgi:hypothetical protein
MVRLRRVAGYAALVLVGAPVAFFTVFNAMFADSSGLPDDVLAWAVTAAVYLVLGVVASFVVRGAPRAAASALAAAAVLVALLYPMREPGVWPVAVIQGLAAWLFAWAGTRLGTRGGLLIAASRDRRR